MLKISNLKAGYNGMEVLKGVDFEVKPAEIVAIIGPNGAGKTTLLKSIFNLAEVYSGKIIFKNKELVGLPTYQLISLGISYVPQGRQVFRGLTVKENLEMGAYTKLKIHPVKCRFAAISPLAKLFNRAENEKLKINELLRERVYKFFPWLQSREQELAKNLSGGQQQMLSIGRALIQDPELMLLDEPSLGLAPKVMKEVFNKIQTIAQEGITVIIVEQNAKQAVSIADRTYVLEDGRIALTGGREILEYEKIKNIYLGGR